MVSHADDQEGRQDEDYQNQQAGELISARKTSHTDTTTKTGVVHGGSRVFVVVSVSDILKSLHEVT